MTLWFMFWINQVNLSEKMACKKCNTMFVTCPSFRCFFRQFINFFSLWNHEKIYIENPKPFQTFLRWRFCCNKFNYVLTTAKFIFQANKIVFCCFLNFSGQWDSFLLLFFWESCQVFIFKYLLVYSWGKFLAMK